MVRTNLLTSNHNWNFERHLLLQRFESRRKLGSLRRAFGVVMLYIVSLHRVPHGLLASRTFGSLVTLGTLKAANVCISAMLAGCLERCLPICEKDRRLLEAMAYL